MFRKYQELCRKCHVDFKKDLLILSIVILLFLGLLVFFLFVIKNNLYAVACLLLIAIYFFIHISNLNDQFKKIAISKEIAFNGFYRYLINLLKNGNILYSALKMTLDYADEVLLDDINELILDIENDTSLEPFLKFQSNFIDDNIKQMIILLYKTEEIGSVDVVLDSINECMINMQDTSIEKYVKKETNKIEKYYLVPIILSAVVIIVLSLYIFSLLGEGIYV